ncbi:MAG: hypothetical protein N3F65_03970 [Nitrososphaeria archaeon]|nr:hypothetical protein [Nitrososphaeria archaeon]MDW8021875.1 hypothetical protein [Nitrososphaerota archaeon]
MKNWIVAATIVLAIGLLSLIYLSTSKPQPTAPELTYEVGGCLDQVMDEIRRGAPIGSVVEVEVEESSIKLLHHLRYVCCAEIKAELETVEEVDDQILLRIRERNAGEMCRCICDYEVSMKISGLKPGTYKLQVIGVEFEDMPVEVLWEGLVKMR